ncbi:MAG: hypothetical protein CMN05_11750 [Roseibacillus sp.]|jgi:hypothetical protein|nr:hypothetical protein [Roseibacillus sp.]MCP4729066.1 DUF1566 domain-containing protein [Roseibacillus sp.]MDP6208406.1 DUF1566 domain-containing protein [Roseibacillus sp.]MDP7307355.1 DUF1566 domain-containing protein [Roseibacillus sp.]MDP7495600.1 DUF1566 domain-containing protein [Roseibacillus sp.]|tara:strand:+ start:19842 stop:21314 length:1473 start_codon:yes stop_codon:yes gene_type:complete
MKTTTPLALITSAFTAGTILAEITSPIVDTGQEHCYDGRTAIRHPDPGEPFHGQDGQYAGNPPSYRDNGDGTVSDLVTGLMWQQDPGAKQSYQKAVTGASRCRTGGHTDWRLPSIKELYSLILFSGTDPDPRAVDEEDLHPFIDDSAFRFQYGREKDGDRIIDSQFATRTRYVSTTMGGNKTMFGVNFADGRIKGYPVEGRRNKKYYVFYVRGNPHYGKNKFRDNRNGTITDTSTGLTWTRTDSGKGLNWQDALAYAKNLELGGHSDWRLPNAKELQSIVDYSRSPDTTKSAAIDPLFDCTSFRNEGGKNDFAHYWTSTTHVRGNGAGHSAVYLAFGRSLGWMQDRRSGKFRLMDVHGAGSQRSDPKSGKATEFPRGRGPQGDVIRIENFVRCVRSGTAKPIASGPALETGKEAGRRSPGRGENPPGRSGHFIKRLDRNGDGKVSKVEFDGPPHHFDRLDRDKDGYLSDREAPRKPPERPDGPGAGRPRR